MRQYWINFNGKQDGPMSLEQLAQMGVDETAYVWHSGLPDWVKITAVPELKEILRQAPSANSEEPVPELPQQEEIENTAPADVQDAKDTDVAEEEIPSLEQEEIPPLEEQGQQTQYYNPQTPVYPQSMSVAAQQQQQEMPKCPPTNLVWAIIATILCCMPAGIIAIVFALYTKKYYRQGNFEKAQRMSDYGAWAVIASIILGIITTPLSCAVQMAQTGMMQ